MSKIKVAIVGSGKIGSDLMIKVMRHGRHMEMDAMEGIDAPSDGLEHARQQGVTTTAHEVEGLVRLPEFGEIGILPDASSAIAHGKNDAYLRCVRPELRCIDLTPAAISPCCAEGYIYLSNRPKDMLISGGVNIYPVENEHVLSTHAGVKDCDVFGVPEEELSESLLALVEPELHQSLSAPELKRWLRERMANYKVPRRIEFVDELPREQRGKIFKRKLHERYCQEAARAI